MLDQRRVPTRHSPAVCVVLLTSHSPCANESGEPVPEVVNVIMHRRCAMASGAHVMCPVPHAADHWRCYHCGQLISAVPTL